MIRTRLTSAAVILGLSFAPGGAIAHSKEETTLPENGAVLQTSPETIRVTFNTPMRVTLIELRDDAGVEHALARSDGMKPVTEFEAVPDLLPAGRFVIEWRGLSSDGHPMMGQFSFEIED